MTAADHAVSLRNDLVCPGCEYSLRGLTGDVVTCPECGERIDVATLVTKQWRKPWWDAPGYSLLCLPCGVGIVGTFIAVVFAGPELMDADPVIAALGLAGIFVVWLTTMGVANRRLPGGRGLEGAIIAHVILLAYLAAAALSVLFIVRAVLFSSLSTFILYLLLLAIPLGLVFLGRRGEKMIAGWLIREHLRRTAAAPPPPSPNARRPPRTLRP